MQETTKRKGKPLTRQQKVLLGVVGVIAALAVLVFVVSYLTKGDWLTARMYRHEDKIYYLGADLTEQAETEGQIQTYYSQGKWTVLIWDGYIYLDFLGRKASVWRVPMGYVSEHLLWRSNKDWSVDFYWPKTRGGFPPGADVGTSSH